MKQYKNPDRRTNPRLQALKPHRTGVTALCLTVEHRLLASAGEDRSVYLYKVFLV